ncbi:MAG: hypothetical protein IIT46_04290 [Lachnospiraceae bacterium]|nr:hypothetical protein [Lachnospiraceae bacterium]
MNKYRVLENKLKKISSHIDEMNIKDEVTKKYLMHYKDYVNQLIEAVHNKTIRNSDGALLGLIGGISDYDELCADDTFFQLVADADNYYCNECQSF